MSAAGRLIRGAHQRRRRLLRSRTAHAATLSARGSRHRV